jgi:hypothetical protein
MEEAHEAEQPWSLNAVMQLQNCNLQLLSSLSDGYDAEGVPQHHLASSYLSQRLEHLLHCNLVVTVLSRERVRRHGAQEEEDKSRSPNAVDETRRSLVESLKTTRCTPDLSLEEIGWVERLGGGEA